ncbi:MAG: ferrous iron transport protein B [Bacteroidetes bacterium]|nr:ferrous iron transport protein B [Bacteroidota bacterium]
MKKIALLGNPNTGKSSIFNLLTGLKQKTGNFAGVTVDLKVGFAELNNEKYQFIDFPGTYSIFPRSNEERVVFETLQNKQHNSFPDALMVILDSSNLERNLLLFDQLYDLNLPILLVLNMTDKAKKYKISLQHEALQQMYPNATIIEVNGRIGLGKDRILEALSSLKQREGEPAFPFDEGTENHKQDIEKRRIKIKRETSKIIDTSEQPTRKKSQRADRFFLHPVFGYVFFLVVLFSIFQGVFTLAAYPMDWIDQGFAFLSNTLSNSLPPGIATDLLTQGVLPGIGGVVVFVPQIALLFLFIGILEETGYLTRVIFLMDRLMRPLGLNGRSVVPLISSWACAVPGIMAARMITNWKERMITIMVAPLMSCSARIPVYTILISIVIPNENLFGFLNLQGLVMLGLYVLGLVSALIVAFVLNRFIQNKDRSFLLLELPSYHLPRWENVGTMVYDKTKTFVLDAGKIILALSIVLWFGASFGPKGHVVEMSIEQLHPKGVEAPKDLNAEQLEHSFIGIFGQAIEPAIRPLGYDWKIGIALITSFAAREVFVGTLATIYSVENGEENEKTLIAKMKSQRFSDGRLVYSFASGISLLIFYVYALQCMATVAVVRKETNSWAWAIGQLVAFSLLAYFLSFLTYQFLK